MLDPPSARLHLRRPKAYVDTGAKYKVLVDGSSRGRIGNGKELTVPVDTGRHQVQLRYFWCSSPTIGVDAQPGAAVEFDCRPVNPNNPFAVFTRMLFGRKHYMDLLPAGGIGWQANELQ